jgi:hypothetical protein
MLRDLLVIEDLYLTRIARNEHNVHSSYLTTTLASSIEYNEN